MATVALDGKSAIEGTLVRESRPGHYLTDLLHSRIAAVKKRRAGLEFTLRWVPGHQEVTGNEQADTEAKLAATGDSSSIRLLPPTLRKTLPVSLPKAKQVYNKALETQAAERWRTSKRGQKMRQVDPALPSSRFPKLVAPLAWRNTSLLIQLRTGHVPLNHHLHTIGRANTQRCPGCGAAKETVLHFVLQCPKYALQRRVYFGPLGRNGQRLEYLLSTKEGIERLFKLVNAARRLHQTFDELKTTDHADRGGGTRNGRDGEGRSAGRQRGGNAPRPLRQTTLSFRPSSS